MGKRFAAREGRFAPLHGFSKAIFFLEVSRHNLLHNFIGIAPLLTRSLGQPGLQVGFEVNFHVLMLRENHRRSNSPQNAQEESLIVESLLCSSAMAQDDILSERKPEEHSDQNNVDRSPKLNVIAQVIPKAEKMMINVKGGCNQERPRHIEDDHYCP